MTCSRAMLVDRMVVFSMLVCETDFSPFMDQLLRADDKCRLFHTKSRSVTNTLIE